MSKVDFTPCRTQDMNVGKIRPLRIGLAREELVALTGVSREAMVLNQLIYWSKIMGDVDEYIEEERERASGVKATALTHGWIHKTAADLIQETCLTVSPRTMLRVLAKLVEKGWIEKENRPLRKNENRLVYRVDMVKVVRDLENIGYTLQGHYIPASVTAATTAHHSSALTDDPASCPMSSHQRPNIVKTVKTERLEDLRLKKWTMLKVADSGNLGDDSYPANPPQSSFDEVVAFVEEKYSAAFSGEAISKPLSLKERNGLQRRIEVDGVERVKEVFAFACKEFGRLRESVFSRLTNPRPGYCSVLDRWGSLSGFVDAEIAGEPWPVKKGSGNGKESSRMFDSAKGKGGKFDDLDLHVE